MGLFDLFKRGRNKYDIAALAQRAGFSEHELARVDIEWSEFHVPKRNGRGTRRILAPGRELKHVQRRLLRRVFALLVSHPAAMGFERGRSIVTHAEQHVGADVLINLDIRRFFESTHADRVERFMRHIGWDRAAAKRIVELCTYDGHLPQGAPTSPKLANLVNYKLDARITALCTKRYAVARYSRYAYDIAVSLRHGSRYVREVGLLLGSLGEIVFDEGYMLNGRKTRVRRKHQQQRVCGLVVNERVRLPRELRRKLRAIDHRMKTTGTSSLSEAQYEGWCAYREMVGD